MKYWISFTCHASDRQNFLNYFALTKVFQFILESKQMNKRISWIKYDILVSYQRFPFLSINRILFILKTIRKNSKEFHFSNRWIREILFVLDIYFDILNIRHVEVSLLIQHVKFILNSFWFWKNRCKAFKKSANISLML